MMINGEHTADVGGCKGAAASLHLPYILHLQPAELRHRAAAERADAMALSGRYSAACVAMLLADAERCEARAAELEMVWGLQIPLVPQEAQAVA
ncbi:hypothetical protein [Azospirillum doebereinerae]|uniref:Uncharacterized protein n=1 Tax=Azospirillum doebereinerae TaxID=92933 RepID=A0A433IZ50_9PROT|nr:hypothetical protein [Azospirillum doebereinerae]RUQ59750.1 hypothetical protein EJ913_31010 [Azospirillum doebereinerae]